MANYKYKYGYTVATSDGVVIGAFNRLQNAIEHANSRANIYKELFVRDTATCELMHYTKCDW